MKSTFIIFISILISVNTHLFSQVVVESTNTQSEEKPSKDSEKIFDFPEVEAKFKGKTGALQDFISKNIRYPSYAIENNIKGKVYLTFVVEKNGSISNVQVEKGVHTSLDEESIRVIESMPKWKPAKYKGVIVRSRMRLPISYTMN